MDCIAAMELVWAHRKFAHFTTSLVTVPEFPLMKENLLRALDWFSQIDREDPIRESFN